MVCDHHNLSVEVVRRSDLSGMSTSAAITPFLGLRCIKQLYYITEGLKYFTGTLGFPFRSPDSPTDELIFPGPEHTGWFSVVLGKLADTAGTKYSPPL